MEFFHTLLTQAVNDFMPLYKVSSYHSKCPTLWFTLYRPHLRIDFTLKKAKLKVDKSKDPDDRSTFTKLKESFEGDYLAGET